MIKKETAMEALQKIYDAIWEVDIPSPTVPEYVEHHEEMQELMRLVSRQMKKMEEADEVKARGAKTNTHIVTIPGILEKSGRRQQTNVVVRFTSDKVGETLSMDAGNTMIICSFQRIEKLIQEARDDLA